MTERGITLIDVDENRLELWLKPDRVQLVVIDSRPELEAGELRRFASILFGEYVGRDLAARLAAARLRLQEARAGAAGDELIGSLDGALQAIEDVTAAMTVSEADLAPLRELRRDDDERAEIALAVEPRAEPIAPPPAQLTGRQPYRPLKAARGKRAREHGSVGWRRCAAEQPAHASGPDT